MIGVRAVSGNSRLPGIRAWPCSRMLLVAIAMLLLPLPSGCARWSPGLTQDEAGIAAWWCEDLIHGVPRRTEELQLVSASPAMTKLATWLAGDRLADDRRQPPELLRSRQTRRPVLASYFTSGWIRIDDRGLVGPAPDLTPTDFAIAAEAADAETGDRQRLDSVILALIDANARQASWWNDAARAARQHWDRADGGRVWDGKPTVPAR